MKLYGYQVGSDEERPMQLEEVAVAADAATLRRLSQFLLHVAAQMEAHGDRFGHEHFEDFDRSAPKKPRFVVTGPIIEDT